jgi:hypothetical protein
MKTTKILAALISFLLVIGSCNVLSGQTVDDKQSIPSPYDKYLRKEMKNEAKKRLKELKKEGYKVPPTEEHTFEVALLNYYNIPEDQFFKFSVLIETDAKLTNARENAIFKAKTNFAAYLEELVRGGNFRSNEQKDKFLSEFYSLVQQLMVKRIPLDAIKTELYREPKKDDLDYIAFFAIPRAELLDDSHSSIDQGSKTINEDLEWAERLKKHVDSLFESEP